MKSNYDRSKTITRKTTKKYHHDPLLLKIADLSVLILKNRMKATDYLCIIVHWKYALPWRLVYNFGCLPLKILNCLSTGDGFLSSFPADMSLRPWWGYSDRQVHGHYGVIGQTSHKNTDFFLFWPGHSQKYAFLKGRKKTVYATLRFSRVYFNRCHPGDDTGNENSLQIIRRSGRSATLAKSKYYRPIGGVRHVFRVQLYTGSLWLSSSF